MMMLKMELKPIGVVRRLDDTESVLQIRAEHRAGLDGVTPGAMIQVLYWMSELSSPDRKELKVHPRGDTARPTRGVFSLRSSKRPNPVGVSVVEVDQVIGLHVVVRGLDARDGSPLIDIKAEPASF